MGVFNRVARRLVWRAGRRLYRSARGEGRNLMTTNGEAYVQSRFLAAIGNGQPANVFDVGANVGDWTGMLLDKRAAYDMSNIRVFCFEPTAETHARLTERFRSLEEVHIVKLAMSDRSGPDRMAVTSETGGTNTLVFDNALASQALRIAEIDKSTIADFCSSQEIENVHLVKSDTEGHDLAVIRGACRLFEREAINLFQFEYNHRWVYARSFIKDVFDLFAGTPYQLARICPNCIEILPAWHPELERFFEGNYLILHERALSWFDVHFGHFDASNTYA